MPVTVEQMYERLEEREAGRLRMKVMDARAWLARSMGVTVGTLTNLRLNRLKRPEYLENKINAAIIKSIEAEIAQLSHELDVAKQRGLHPGSNEIIAAETHLAQARRLIGK